jgi:hypothetical protein
MMYQPQLGPCDQKCIEKMCLGKVSRLDEKNAIHQDTGTYQRSTIYACQCGANWFVVEEFKTWEDWRGGRNSHIVMQRTIPTPKKGTHGG